MSHGWGPTQGELMYQAAIFRFWCGVVFKAACLIALIAIAIGVLT